MAQVSESGSMANAENNVDEMIGEIKIIEDKLSARQQYLLVCIIMDLKSIVLLFKQQYLLVWYLTLNVL